LQHQKLESTCEISSEDPRRRRRRRRATTRIAASNSISWLLQEHYPFTSTLHFVLRLMIRTQTEQENPVLFIYSLLSLNFQLLNFLGFGTILLCVCVYVCFGFVGYVCCAELRILKLLSLCSSNGKFSSRIVVSAFCILLVALELRAVFFFCLFFSVTLLLSECLGWNHCVCFAARRYHLLLP
jgi:hypothetical protein